MNELTENIYYADKNLLEILPTDFDLIDKKDWFKLYRKKADGSFWRLDEWDKYQERFFVRLPSIENWNKFNDKNLRIELLLRTRGTSTENCIWKDCNKLSLNGIVYCEVHALGEMGINK